MDIFTIKVWAELYPTLEKNLLRQLFIAKMFFFVLGYWVFCVKFSEFVSIDVPTWLNNIFLSLVVLPFSFGIIFLVRDFERHGRREQKALREMEAIGALTTAITNDTLRLTKQSRPLASCTNELRLLLPTCSIIRIEPNYAELIVMDFDNYNVILSTEDVQDIKTNKLSILHTIILNHLQAIAYLSLFRLFSQYWIFGFRNPRAHLKSLGNAVNSYNRKNAQLRKELAGDKIEKEPYEVVYLKKEDTPNIFLIERAWNFLKASRIEFSTLLLFIGFCLFWFGLDRLLLGGHWISALLYFLTSLVFFGISYIVFRFLDPDKNSVFPRGGLAIWIGIAAFGLVGLLDILRADF
jgi:hypothetical protein